MMRSNHLWVGMLAGTMIGAVAAAIVMPYVTPQIDKMICSGKKIISSKLKHMEDSITE